MRKRIRRWLWSACWGIGDTFMVWAFKLGKDQEVFGSHNPHGTTRVTTSGTLRPITYDPQTMTSTTAMVDWMSA